MSTYRTYCCYSVAQNNTVLEEGSELINILLLFAKSCFYETCADEHCPAENECNSRRFPFSTCFLRLPISAFFVFFFCTAKATKKKDRGRRRRVPAPLGLGWAGTKENRGKEKKDCLPRGLRKCKQGVGDDGGGRRGKEEEGGGPTNRSRKKRRRRRNHVVLGERARENSLTTQENTTTTVERGKTSSPFCVLSLFLSVSRSVWENKIFLGGGGTPSWEIFFLGSVVLCLKATDCQTRRLRKRDLAWTEEAAASAFSSKLLFGASVGGL